MIDKNEITAFIIEKVEKKAEQLGIELDNKIDSEFSLTGSGVFDSMDFMNLIAEVEDKFNVEVDFSNEEPTIFTKIYGFVGCIK
jgi:acyl carrier protein